MDGAKKEKAAPGQGYTVRVDGKKVLRSSLLESQISQMQKEYSELLAQNEALREKEAEQLKICAFYDVWVDRIAASSSTSSQTAAHGDATQSTGDSSTLPDAARLDRRVRKLKQELQPQQEVGGVGAGSSSAAAAVAAGAGQATEAQGDIATGGPSTAAGGGAAGRSRRSSSSSAAAAAAASSRQPSSSAAAAAAGGISAAAAAGAGPSSSTQAGGAAAAAGSGQGGFGEAMMTRWHAAITPEDLKYISNWTPEEFGVRLRSIIARLALTHHMGTDLPNSASAAPLPTAFEVLEEMGKLCALVAVGNEKALLLAYQMNLETLQMEPPPPELWPQVVAAAKLSPQQTAKLTEAFNTYNKQCSELVAQQRAITQQLQAIMGAAGAGGAACWPPAGNLAGNAAAAGASNAAVPSDARLSGPAHYMSLATGEPVPGSAAAGGGDAGGDGTGAGAAGAPNGGGAAGADGDFEAFLTDFLRGVQEQQQGDGSAASHAGGSSGGGGASSASACSWLAPAGVLALQDAEKVEKLLADLSRIGRLAKLQMHYLTVMFIELLTTDQRAIVVLASYPWLVALPEFVGCVAQAGATTQ